MKNYSKFKNINDDPWKVKWYYFMRKFSSYIYNTKSTKTYHFFNKWIFDPWYNIKYGIDNIIKWVPVIWGDRNFDHSNIYTILQHKLLLTRNHIVYSNRFESVDQVNRDITICLNLIERVKEGFYDSEYSEYLDQDIKFNELDELIDGERYFSMDFIVKRDDLDQYFAKYPSAINRAKKEVKYFDGNDNKSLAMKLGTYNHERAKKLLFKIIENKIQQWWD